jgi:5-methylcytosine-specific restriction endonuclease McrA
LESRLNGIALSEIAIDTNQRVCKICDNQFNGFVDDGRVFCYDCVPSGLSPADADRYRKRAMKHLLVEYKGGKCVECGYDKCEGSLQFHHLNENDKDFTISHVKPGVDFSMVELYEEADKCVLLCANCHIRKHEVVDKIATIMRLPSNNNKTYDVRRCGICNSEFEANTKNRIYCYNCSPSGLKAADVSRVKKRSIKHEILIYKGNWCVLCGFDASESALHFHHRNPNEKEFTISETSFNDTDFNMDRMRKEADKCDVLCANCHFEAHYKNDDDLDD